MMKSLLSILMLSATAVLAKEEENMLGVKDLFNQWKAEFGRKYESAKEAAHRMEVWVDNHCKYLKRDAESMYEAHRLCSLDRGTQHPEAISILSVGTQSVF